MTYTLARPSATQITVAVRVPHAELEPFVSKAATVISDETEIEGFRKGKAPYDVVKNAVGEFKILEEAARLYINKNFEKILREAAEKEFAGKSFEPVGDPAISITKLAPGEELEFKITLSLLPPIELPDYKAIARRVLASRNVPAVTEDEVHSAIGRLRESRAKLVTVNREARPGDRVEVDFSGSLGGVKIEGGESKNHPIILGEGRMLPGFEEAIAGMRAGEEKAFTLAVPPDYRAKAIAGKVLDFTIKMNSVQEREVPAWSDDFARSLGNFSSTADVEKSVREGLQTEKERKEKERLRMATAEAVASETKAEIPEPLIERESKKMLAELKESTESMGLKFEEYLTQLKKTEEGLRRGWREAARRRVKIALVLREIARRETIEPTADEIEESASRAIAHRDLAAEDIKRLDRAALFDYHRGIARNEKVFQWLEALSF